MPVDWSLLGGLLGMTEMELVVEWMLNTAEEKGTPFSALEVSPLDIPKDKGSLLLGFCQMCCRGYFVSSYPNACFTIDKSLIERMRRHQECWKDLPDPPTWQEWYDNKYGRWFASLESPQKQEQP